MIMVIGCSLKLDKIPLEWMRNFKQWIGKSVISLAVSLEISTVLKNIQIHPR